MVGEVLNLEDVLKVIHRWNPFNQEESAITHMHDLYQTYYQVPMVAHSKHYTILFHAHTDKDAFQSMANDRMFICNHNFYWLAELVSTDC